MESKKKYDGKRHNRNYVASRIKDDETYEWLTDTCKHIEISHDRFVEHCVAYARDNAHSFIQVLMK